MNIDTLTKKQLQELCDNKKIKYAQSWKKDKLIEILNNSESTQNITPPPKNTSKTNSKHFTIAETFVGCGGSHFGFKKAGFDAIFVNDIWDDALKTLKLNDTDIEDHRVILGDLNTVTQDKLNDLNIDYSNLDILIGGVVCKGFSLAGVRNPLDPRNYLYLEQLRLVKLLKPKISIIENVPGMMNMRILKKQKSDNILPLCKELDDVCNRIKINRGKLIALNKKSNVDKELEKTLSADKVRRVTLEKKLDDYKYGVVDDIEKTYIELGYKVYKEVLCCNDFDCATNRRRIFIVAIRNDLDIEWEYPQPTLNKPTVRDALDTLDLENLNNPQNDPDNVPMNHKASTVEKFKKIVAGVKQEGGYFSRGSNQRLAWDTPAPTLVPGHSAFQVHPEEHRSITIREGATLTSFPNDFKFYGSHSSRCIMIGNSICPNMAYHLALQCKKYLENL